MAIQSMNVTHAPIGSKNEIAVFCKGRKCPICKTPLNSYTPGPFCCAHEFKGALMKIGEEAQRSERRKARYRKMMAKKSKEKKRKIT